MKLSFALSLLLLSLPVFAHPGHDHSHWLSHFLHASIAIGLIVAVIAAVKTLTKNQQEN